METKKNYIWSTGDILKHILTKQIVKGGLFSNLIIIRRPFDRLHGPKKAVCLSVRWYYCLTSFIVSIQVKLIMTFNEPKYFLTQQSSFLLTKWSLTAWFTDYSRSYHNFLGVSAFCVIRPDGHNNPWYGFLNLMLPFDSPYHTYRTRTTIDPSNPLETLQMLKSIYSLGSWVIRIEFVWH